MFTVHKHFSFFLPSPDHSRILLFLDELDRKTTHSNISVFTKWQRGRNVSDVIHSSASFISTSFFLFPAWLYNQSI